MNETEIVLGFIALVFCVLCSGLAIFGNLSIIQLQKRIDFLDWRLLSTEADYLEAVMKQCVENEDYEKAAKYKKIIESKDKLIKKYSEKYKL